MALLHDEMKVKADLVYDRRSGRVVGFTNPGSWTFNEVLQLNLIFISDSWAKRVFPVHQLTLIFCPVPKLFHGTFSRNLFKYRYTIFAFQCSFDV